MTSSYPARPALLPAHTQLDQLYDQRDQLNVQAGHAGIAGFYSLFSFAQVPLTDERFTPHPLSLIG